MKESKREIKYIIRRILVGVGIAVILFNLKKCNVYALDRYSYVFPSRSGYIDVSNTQQNAVYIPNIGTKSVINNINVVESQIADDLTIHFGTENANNYSTFPTTLLHVLYENEYDIFLQLSFNPNGTYWSKLSSGDYKILFINNPDSPINGNSTDFLLAYMVPTTDIDKPLSQISDKTLMNFAWSITYTNLDSQISSSHCPFPSSSGMCNNIYNATTTDSSSNTVYFGNKNINGYVYKDIFDPTKSEIILNKDDIFVYNGEILEPAPTDPLESLTRVDLTGKAGVLIVPKSYETMLEDYSTTTQPTPGVFNTFLNFSIYTEYCTRQTLANLTNTRDLIINNIGTSTGSLSASISGTCPSEPTETIFTYQYDMYTGMIPMGILVYNNEINDSAYSSNSYGTSYVWYDSTIYDIYIVDDLDNFSASISFTDYDGSTKNLQVDEIPTFEEMAQYAIDNNVSLNKNTLNSLFANVKSPFSFLNKLNKTSCVAMRFPFPKSDQIIILPCMSSVYENIAGDLVPTIAIIVNGLIIYRCVMNLIFITTTMMDPNDDKLEVLEL